MKMPWEEDWSSQSQPQTASASNNLMPWEEDWGSINTAQPEQAQPQPQLSARDQGRQAGAGNTSGQAFQSGAAQGLSFGLGDEISGVVNAGWRPLDESGNGWLPAGAADAGNRLIGFATGAGRLAANAVGIGDGSATADYERGRDYARGVFDQQKQESPYAFGGGELTGALVPGVGAVKVGATAARAVPAAFAASRPVATSAGIGAVDSGIFNGLYGTGNAEEGERIKGGLTSGAIGTVGGGALGVVAPYASQFARILGRKSSGAAPEAAERLGVDLPSYIASENQSINRFGETLKNIPGSGNKISEANMRLQNQMSITADNVADAYGRGSPYSAGTAVEKAANEGWTGRATEISNRLYDAVDNMVDPQVLTPLNATREAVAGLTARSNEAAIAGGNRAADQVRVALSRDGLTYNGLKNLRTHIRELKETSPSGDLNKIYDALSIDLRSAAQNSGGDRALTAFDRANTYYANMSQKKEQLRRMLGTKTEEGIYHNILGMAGDGKGAALDRLRSLRSSVPADVWDDVAGTAISRMGRSPNGEFSAQRFLSDYSKLSPEGRNILFASTTKKELATSLDDLATVSRRMQDFKQFSNSSGTAQNITGTAITAAFFNRPVETLKTVVGGRILANSLAKPTTVKATTGLLNRVRYAQHARSPEYAYGIIEKGAVIYANALNKEFGVEIDPNAIMDAIFTGD